MYIVIYIEKKLFKSWIIFSWPLSLSLPICEWIQARWHLFSNNIHSIVLRVMPSIATVRKCNHYMMLIFCIPDEEMESLAHDSKGVIQKASPSSFCHLGSASSYRACFAMYKHWNGFFPPSHPVSWLSVSCVANLPRIEVISDSHAAGTSKSQPWGWEREQCVIDAQTHFHQGSSSLAGSTPHPSSVMWFLWEETGERCLGFMTACSWDTCTSHVALVG